MREQIEHLLALSRLPHVTIQLVPFESRAAPTALSGLRRLAAPGELGELPEYLDYVFSRTGTELNWSDNVWRYEILWSRVTGAALTPAETRFFLTTALRDFP
jgi:hypothetical protein